MSSKLLQLQRLEKAILNCNVCTRLREVTPIPYPHIYYGDPEKLDIFMLMRNPGLEHSYTEVQSQEFLETYKKNWLICNVGKYVENIFGKDFIMNRMFFVNICKCSSPSNSKLNKEEIINCRNFLNIQLDIIKPKVILSFGAEANAFIKSSDIKIPYKTFYHPAAFSYNVGVDAYNEQAKKLREAIK
jgi:uracil-DNA glycosylase